MLLGYNQQRPTEGNYTDFQEKLFSGLDSLGIDGLSLMIYGSFVRGDYQPGRSDIDAVMTFADDVVINKQNLALVADVVYQALNGNNVPFQVSVSDLETMRDGRFNTYDKSFKEYFDEEGRIVFGPDYRAEFCYELPTMNEQGPLRFNLRKSRIGLLFAERDRNEDYESFLRNFGATLNAVSRGSKQVVYLVDGQLRKNRFAAKELVNEMFPNVDIDPLIRIKELFDDKDKLDALYRKPDEVIDLWNESLTFFEQLIREYIRANPKA